MRKQLTIVLVCTAVASALVFVPYFFPFSLSNGTETISVGYSPSFAPTNADLDATIRGGFADYLGLGELDPMCENPPDLFIGTTFDCTATTSTGEVIDITGTVTAEDFYLETTNVVEASALEEAFFRGYSEQNPQDGLTLPNVECGQGLVVLENLQTTCSVLTDRFGLETFTLTFANMDLMEFDWAIR